MRLFCSFFLLLLVVMVHLGSGRRFGGGSRSSSSRSSSSSSRSSWGSSRSSSSRPSSSRSSWGSSRSSSSSSSKPRKSLGTKIKEKIGFGKKKPSSSGSSYPKQQWSSSTNNKMAGSGGSTPIGGGFTQPKTSSGTNFAAGGLAGAGAGGLAGGLLGKGSSSSLGGGGFVQPKPFGGSSTLGGGGFVNPKPSSGAGFGSFGNTKPVTSGSNFGAGGIGGSSGGFGSFGNTKPITSGSNFGAGGIGGSSGGSGWKKMAGAGLAGGVLGGGASQLGKGYKKNPFGTSQYSSFAKPKKSLGSYMFGSSKKKYGYKTPGYGTAYGTNFAGGVGKYKAKKGFSKKALGLGIGAGFLGGAALGVAGTMASYSVYHRYQEFKRMMSIQQPGYGGYNDGYYNSNYLSNTCIGGCPMNSHCEWGFCECNAGTSRKWGRCESNWSNIPPRVSSFDPFKTCSSSATCMAMDMNLVCNTELTTQGNMGKCECRPDMKWNTESGECQMYLDVDCSKITYDTKPSPYISSAVERAVTAQAAMIPVIGETVALGRTESMQESLSNSLLKQVDPKLASSADMTEAFCRDIDAYSFEFQQSQAQTPGLPLAPVGKPPKCQDVPLSACAVAYDSHDCGGGWRLVIPQGGLRFRWWTSYWTYRNDIDTLGIRAGCSLTAFTDSSYNGDRVTIAADRGYDRWVVLGEEAQYLHMDQDIESVQCVCRT